MKSEPRQGDAQQPTAGPCQPDDPGSTTRGRLLRATTSLSLKLGLASALVVSLVIGAGAMFAYHGEKQQLLRAMHEAASTQGSLVLTGLKSAMLENNRTLLTDLIDEYARSSEVERIHVVDSTGQVTFTTEPSWSNRFFDLPPDLCPTCSVSNNASQTRTAVVEEGGHSIMRSLTVVSNEARCHRCHPAGQSLLGALVVDLSMAHVHQARAAIISRTLQWGAAVCILVLVAVGAVVQLGALRRLRRLRDAARSLSAGTGMTLPARRRDEIGELAHDIRMVSFTLRSSMAEVDLQRQFLIDLIDRIDDGVAVFDSSLKVVAANKSYLTRVSRTELDLAQSELTCADGNLCLHNESPTNCPTRRALRTRRLEKTLHRHHMGDREVYYEVFASPMTGRTNSVEHVVEVWRDVTERVTIEANLAHSEQLATVGVLASGFSHEISTPLGTIATSIQGILRRLHNREHLDAPDIEALRARLELASHEVFRCRDITRSLLNLSRKRRTAPDRLAVTSLVTRMLDVVRPTAERQSVSIECGVRSDLPMLPGHVDQLEQLMLNLYMNAIEAMPEGGTLAVRVASRDGGVEIIVSDTGVGILPQDRPQIFEPFFSRKTGGTGLGLYLSRQVVEAHGGQIEVVSSSEQGTQLRVFLPFREESQHPTEVDVRDEEGE